jgi:cold shock CspA family protein
MEKDGLEEYVRQQAGKLERYFSGITSCRVMVEMHGRHRHGNAYHVRIDLGVPDGELLVKHEPSLHVLLKGSEAPKAVKSGELGRVHRKPQVAILDAFSEMRRRLQDYVRTRRGKVKKSAEPLGSGTVSRLYPREDHGFLMTPDSRQIYFHRDSVLDGHFNRLRIGSPVRFAEEMGEKGPQASTVHLVQPRRQARTAARVAVLRRP